MDDFQTIECRRGEDRRPQGPPGPDAGRRQARRRRLPRHRRQAAPGARRAEPVRQGAAGAGPDHAAAAAPQPDVGRLHRGRRHRPRRQGGLRPRHRRPARLRRLRRRAHRQLQRRRRLAGPGRLRLHRVGRRAAVVRRQRRHDRHLLLRLHAGAGRGRAPAAPEGDLRLRRPLRLLRDHLPRRHHVVHAACRPRGPRRRLRLGVHRQRQVPHAREVLPGGTEEARRQASAGSGRRRLAEPGARAELPEEPRGLVRHRDERARRRLVRGAQPDHAGPEHRHPGLAADRPGPRLDHGRHHRAVRRAEGPQEAGHRPVPADAVAPLHRGARQDVPLVRLLDQGHRQRRHGRAGRERLRRGLARAGDRGAVAAEGRRVHSRSTCARATSCPPSPSRWARSTPPRTASTRRR